MDEAEASDAPFEWLTSFRSIRHLTLPSRIALGLGSSTPTSSSPQEQGASSSDSNDHLVETPSSPSEQPTVVKLNALHVGCGTSTVGESLLCLRERTPPNNTILQFGHVLNVDNDKHALESMQRRWEKKKPDTTTPKNKQSNNENNQNEEELEMGNIEWKYLDFTSDESCRAALDGVYHHQQQQQQQQLMKMQNNNTSSIIIEQQQPGGCFDLVLDKSTLDCLLCAESNVVAQLLCEAYRALRVPASSSNEHPNDTTTTTTKDDAPPSWGGLYVLVTFHPVEFIERLLTQLPGADWHVEHEVIKREVEIVKEEDAWEVDEVNHQSNNPTTKSTEKDINMISPSSSSAWSSGIFHPDENYRKTVTVFTCRRCCTESQKDGIMSTSTTPLPSYILDREQVQEHIERTCDDWYKKTNPMVTSEREEQLRGAFLEVGLAEMNLGDRKEGREMTPDDISLDLKQCYRVLFTDAEREHLNYEYFIEDWDAYCKRVIDGGDTIQQGSMTLAIALDFLKEMQ